MKNFLLGLLLLLLPACAFAYSDLGLLKNDRTFSYFLLNPTDSSGLSSGLVYNQKQNDRLNFEASLTSYKSAYLLTKNITKVRLDEKYQLLRYGIFSLTGLAGCAVYYSPSTGSGLAGDLGGIAALDIQSNLAVALGLNAAIFRDGLEMDVEPMVSFVPGIIQGLEIYAGGRVEASMVGTSFDGTGGGKFNTYVNAGARYGL